MFLKAQKILQFRMKDKQSPYNHGGGKVEYTGQTTIDLVLLNTKVLVPQMENTLMFGL